MEQILHFKDLVRSYSGREFWVYSIDSNNNIVPGLARNPRITQKAVQLIEVTLDNDKYVECTLDHEWILRDGTEIRADTIKNWRFINANIL